MARAGKLIFGGIVLCVVVGLAGCSRDTGGTPTPTGELTEEQKQQIRQLNEQRAEEWGTPKRK